MNTQLLQLQSLLNAKAITAGVTHLVDWGDLQDTYRRLREHVQSEYPVMRQQMRRAIHRDQRSREMRGDSDLAIRRHDYHATRAEEEIESAHHAREEYAVASHLKYLVAILVGNYDHDISRLTENPKLEVALCAKYRLNSGSQGDDHGHL